MAKVLTGTVVSNKMQKTVVVEIKRRVKHPLYKKQINRSTRIKAHDELGTQAGQKVKLEETRPISKQVHFKVVEILK